MRLLFFYCFLPALLFSQSPEIDSLKRELAKSKNDTMRIFIKSQIGMAEGIFRIGYWDSLLQDSRKHHYKSMMATAYSNIGFIYNMKGDVLNALEYYSDGLKLHEQLGDMNDVADAMENIGMVFLAQGDMEQALSYYHQSLDLRLKLKDEEALAYSYNNLGYLFDKKMEYLKAIDYYKRSVAIRVRLGDSIGVGVALNNIGSAYESMENYPAAGPYYMRALKIMEREQDPRELSTLYNNLARLSFIRRDHKSARELGLKSLRLAEQSQSPGQMAYAANTLYKVAKETGQFKEALMYMELSMKMKDSLNNENTRRATVKAQLKHDYEKRAAADSVAHAKETEIKNAELKKQEAEIQAKKNQQVALFGGLFLVLVFAAFMFNRWKVTQQQKGIIELQKAEVEFQKHMVEEKQKEILDSIHYAKRIQLAQIPSERRLANKLERLRDPNT